MTAKQPASAEEFLRDVIHETLQDGDKVAAAVIESFLSEHREMPIAVDRRSPDCWCRRGWPCPIVERAAKAGGWQG